MSHKIFVVLSALSGVQAYAMIFGVLFICGLGVPIPEDITLIAAGFLAAAGSISLTGAFIVGFVGVLVGDIILYSIGRKYGKAVFGWPIARRFFTPERAAKAQERIQKNARFICFTARFAPGLRGAIYLTAGIMHIPVLTFISMDALAALISVPIWVFGGHWFGNNIDGALKFAKHLNMSIITIIAVVAVFFLIRHLLAKRKSQTNLL